MHKGMGWGGRRSTLQQIHRALHISRPDIVFLQEIRGSQVSILASELFPHVSYGKNAVYEYDHHGNAIFSRYPILHSENIDLSMHRYEKRGLLYTKVQPAEHDEPLHLICLHLGLFRRDRHKQLVKLVEFIRARIPEHEAVIIGGDFNDWRYQATIPLVHELAMREAYLSVDGRYAKTFPAWGPILRLDRVYFRHLQVSQAQRLTQKPWRYFSDHIALEVHLNHPLEE